MTFPRIFLVILLSLLVAVPASSSQTKVNCSKPVLASSNTLLAVTCKIEGICSQDLPTCTFTRLTKPLLNVNPTTTYGREDNDSSCFTDCQARFPLSEFHPGIHQFRVDVHQTAGNGGVNNSVFSETTPAIELVSPKVEIARSCPSGSHVEDGYIIIGSTATCDCLLTDPGFPPGRALWNNNRGTDVGRPTQNMSRLLLDFSPTGLVDFFLCRAVSSLNGSYPAGAVKFYPLFKEGSLDDSSDCPATGLGIALGFTLLFSIAATVVAVLLYLKNKRITGGQTTTLPDTNPSRYGNPRDQTASKPRMSPRAIEATSPSSELAPGEYLHPENANPYVESGVYIVTLP